MGRRGEQKGREGKGEEGKGRKKWGQEGLSLCPDESGLEAIFPGFWKMGWGSPMAEEELCVPQQKLRMWGQKRDNLKGIGVLDRCFQT